MNQLINSVLSKRGQAISFPKNGIITQTAEAKGKDINATIGMVFNDQSEPLHLRYLNQLIRLEPKEIYPYAPTAGLPEVRQLWKQKISQENNLADNIFSLPIVSNGITNGLNTIGYLFVNPNDKILIADRYWGNYKLIFQTGFDADLKFYKTFNTDGLALADFQNQIKQIADEKIIILLNFPNNPAGYTPSFTEAEKIVEIIKQIADKGKKLVVVCDDAYQRFLYESEYFDRSIFSKIAKLHKNILAIKLDGASKEAYFWGLRTGFISYGIKGGQAEDYQVLEDKTTAVIRGTISSACHLSQSLLLKAIKHPDYQAEKEKNFQVLNLRYQRIKRILNENKKYPEYFQALPFNSGYFMCLELAQSLTANNLRQKLLEEYQTGVISIEDKLIRIAYSSVPETKLRLLFENIYSACRQLS